MSEREQPPTPRGLFPATAFDIASADDFPSLPLGEVPRGNRAVRLLLCIAYRQYGPDRSTTVRYDEFCPTSYPSSASR